MLKKIKKILIGKPLENEKIQGEKYSVLWGLPILASDAISSVAYAGQEMLTVMLPVIGILSYQNAVYIALAIVGLLTLLMFSYRQTIECYPNGGGAFIVAKDNFGSFAGITAGAALSIDYIMTVAVSVSSGVEQLTSAFPTLKVYSVIICVLLVLLLMLGNLRGIRESSKIFGFPTYLFILAIIIMLIGGFYKYFAGIPISKPQAAQQLTGMGSVTLFLILRAFSNGCTALTGIEAVSNAVPSFKQPEVHNARKVLLLLCVIIVVLFGGTSILINIYHPVAGAGQPAVLIQMADQIFGRADVLNSIVFYFITGTLFLILFLAANTAYSGFPMLLSVMASEGFVPRQLKSRGDRLSFSNGIMILSVIALILIVAFQANVSALIGLYTIGVFISFTLSQAGMLKRWVKKKGKHWQVKAVVNGTGAIVTAVAVVIIGITKFSEGAYIVVILLPILIFLMTKVKKHYLSLSKQLHIDEAEFTDPKITKNKYHNRVIVPIASINKSSIRALRYARTISQNITAFSVVIDDEEEKKLRDHYEKLDCPIPLIIKKSIYRKIVDPLLEYIDSAEYNYQKGDIITVVLPQFLVRKWWQKLLHNQTRLFIQRKLLKKKHIAVVTIPFQLKDDDFVLKNNK